MKMNLLMKPLPLLLSIACALVFLPGEATASGGDHSGGGKIIHCKRGPWKGDSLADTFFLKQKGALLLNTGLSEAVLIDSYLENLRSTNADSANVIAARLKTLKFIPVKKIENLDDDGIVVEEPGCKKQQLAIQDIDTGEVRYQTDRYASLPTEEQALFKIHEAFIAEKKKPGMLTTEIRKEVALIPASRSFNEFLIATIYKNQIFPSFKWSDISDDLLAFEATGVMMGHFSQTRKFIDFCTKPSAFMDEDKESLFGRGPIQAEASLRTFYSVLTRSYLMPLRSYGAFFNAVRDARDARDLGLKLYEISNTNWLSVAEIKKEEAQMESNMKWLMKNCPVYSENELLTDWENYKKMVGLIQK